MNLSFIGGSITQQNRMNKFRRSKMYKNTVDVLDALFPLSLADGSEDDLQRCSDESDNEMQYDAESTDDTDDDDTVIYHLAENYWLMLRTRPSCILHRSTIDTTVLYVLHTTAARWRHTNQTTTTNKP